MAETGKQSSYKKLFSNTLVFAIGSFSSKVLVLLLVPIYTNYLTTAELGVTDVLTQIANWIIPLVTMTITEAIIRFGLDKAPAQHPQPAAARQRHRRRNAQRAQTPRAHLSRRQLILQE